MRRLARWLAVAGLTAAAPAALLVFGGRGDADLGHGTKASVGASPRVGVSAPALPAGHGASPGREKAETGPEPGARHEASTPGGGAAERRRRLVEKNLADLEARARRAEASGDAAYAEALRRRAAALRDAEGQAQTAPRTSTLPPTPAGTPDGG